MINGGLDWDWDWVLRTIPRDSSHCPIGAVLEQGGEDYCTGLLVKRRDENRTDAVVQGRDDGSTYLVVQGRVDFRCCSVVQGRAAVVQRRADSSGGSVYG